VTYRVNFLHESIDLSLVLVLAHVLQRQLQLGAIDAAVANKRQTKNGDDEELISQSMMDSLE
jgi:hypothetical protein